MLEEPRIAAKRRLPGPGPIEGHLDALSRGKRQDDAGQQRNGPEGDRRQAGNIRGDEDPQQAGERRESRLERDRPCGQRDRDLRPRRGTNRSRAAVRSRRARRGRRTSGASRRARASCATRPDARAPPRVAMDGAATSRASCVLGESPRDRATERATRGRRDRDRARTGDPRDRAGRRLRVGQRLPVARAARQPSQVHQPQRAVPGHPLVDAARARQRGRRRRRTAGRPSTAATASRRARVSTREWPRATRNVVSRSRAITLRTLRLLARRPWRGARRCRRREPVGSRRLLDARGLGRGDVQAPVVEREGRGVASGLVGERVEKLRPMVIGKPREVIAKAHARHELAEARTIGKRDRSRLERTSIAVKPALSSRSIVVGTSANSQGPRQPWK